MRVMFEFTYFNKKEEVGLSKTRREEGVGLSKTAQVFSLSSKVCKTGQISSKFVHRVISKK